MKIKHLFTGLLIIVFLSLSAFQLKKTVLPSVKEKIKQNSAKFTGTHLLIREIKNIKHFSNAFSELSEDELQEVRKDLRSFAKSLHPFWKDFILELQVEDDLIDKQGMKKGERKKA